MTRTLRRSILAASLLLAGCGAVRDTVSFAAPGEPLRLSRVVLYQNGLAHFERRGRTDQGTVDLLVPAAQVDDVLRTLTVVDGADAAITRVAPRRDGVSAPAAGGDEATAAQVPSHRPSASLLITGVRMLPAQSGDDVRLSVGLATEGARDLRISYVTELPGFRPTYRLVVGEEGRVHVQGLAVVDNPTSEPWQDVALTLSTEVPLSFRFDVREARTAIRPRFGADGRLVREPAIEAPALAFLANGQPSEVDVANGQPSEVNMAYGMAQRGQPEMSTRAGRMVQNQVTRNRVANPPPPIPPPLIPPPPSAPPQDRPTEASSALLAFEDRASEEGGVFGSVEGFDLGRGESGLVPFVDGATEGELALLYKPAPGGALSRTHPYRAVLFRNPSEAPLLTGPVAIYAGERFVGDGVTGTIAARAHAFVPFAIERSVAVEESVEETEAEIRATGLAGGVLEVELQSVHRRRFAVTSTRAGEARIFVFAPALEGFAPRRLPSGSIATPQGYFLPVAVDEQGAGAVVFDLLRRTSSRVNIAADPDSAYVSALLLLLGDDPMVERLRAIADRLTGIEEELETVGEDLRVEREALDERRAALEALRGVASGGAIRQRLGQAVAQGVGRIDALTGRSSELSGEQIALEQEWYGLLRALTVAPPR